jgi:hypothetical protein
MPLVQMQIVILVSIANEAQTLGAVWGWSDWKANGPTWRYTCADIFPLAEAV